MEAIGKNTLRIAIIPNIATNIPTILFIVNKSLSLNFLLKPLTKIANMYHNNIPPKNIPVNNINCDFIVGSSPITEVPAKTAINITIDTGFETVSINNVKKSPNKPVLEIFFFCLIDLSGLSKYITIPTIIKNRPPINCNHNLCSSMVFITIPKPKAAIVA